MMLKYRLITGPDDSSFCQRVFDLLELGYQPHGSSSITFNATQNLVIAAQALI